MCNLHFIYNQYWIKMAAAVKAQLNTLSVANGLTLINPMTSAIRKDIVC